MILFRKRSTGEKLTSEIGKINKAFKVFIKLKAKIEKANEKLQVLIKESEEKRQLYLEAAVTEESIQSIANETIAKQNKTLEQINQFIGEK